MFSLSTVHTHTNIPLIAWSNVLQDNQVRRFPHDGFDWEAFIAQFASLGSYNGMWVPGLEEGKTYTVWDVVTLPDRHTQFNGYTNNERKTVVIP